MKKALAALSIAFACVCGAQVISPLGFFFINQAFNLISGRIFSQTQPHMMENPSMKASIGVAQIINEQLPMETSDGFALMIARSPAPGAIEVKVAAPKGRPISTAELDNAWKVGLVRMFCAETPTIWSRWIAIGGTVGIEVSAPSGELIRRYGASNSDCRHYRSLLGR